MSFSFYSIKFLFVIITNFVKITIIKRNLIRQLLKRQSIRLNKLP